jgi:DeoR family transcriptional regulator of aga operon
MQAMKTLSSVERLNELLRFIERSQRITVAGICSRFQISEATARRDLEILATQGQIKRVHGGAIATRKAPPELPVYQRMNDETEIKKRIGLAVAQLIQDGETVFLGSGTTVLEVARYLARHNNLTVITNSLLVINQLIENPNITVVGLGGLLRRSELSMIGHITEQAIVELNADKVIMGIHGVDLIQGLTNQYLPETVTDRKILQMGREVIIVADHTKCQRISTVNVAPVSVINTLVTDIEAPEDFVHALTEQGVRVLQV